MRTLTSKEITYEVGSLFFETELFRFYEVHSKKFPEEVLLLKIPKSKVNNYLLEKEELLLKAMESYSFLLDQKHKEEFKEDETLGYQICFPKVIDSFVASTEQDRFVLILSLENFVDKLKDFFCVQKILDKKYRVDPKTSVWILGKTLKFMHFVHSQNIIINDLSIKNLFIDQKNHLIHILDWTNSSMLPTLNKKDVILEIKKLVSTVILLLGGNTSTGVIPDHEHLEDSGILYREILINLLQKNISDALSAHKYFYQNVEKIWKKEYYPFTII